MMTDDLKKLLTQAIRENSDSWLTRTFKSKTIVVAAVIVAVAAFSAHSYISAPLGKITSPKEGTPTSGVIGIQGFTKNIPSERKYIWLAVDVDRLDLSWPKRQIPKANGAFTIKIVEAGQPGKFTVSLYAVDR